MEEFCKTGVAQNYFEMTNNQYYNTVVVPALSNFNECLRLENEGLRVTHQEQAPRSVLIYGEITKSTLNATLDIVEYDKDRVTCASPNFSDQSETIGPGDPAREIKNICLEHKPNGFYEADIKDYARIYPFSYIAEDWSRLRRFILPLSLEPQLRRWSDQFFWNRSADTHALLVDMTQTIRRTFRHVARHEKGIQDPLRTIALGSGSCRDLAMLMIAALRSRGIAARFVSGYVHLAEEEHEEEHQMTGGNTHAWVQGYVPGPGWVDFDPSAGVVGNQNLIRVAVVEHPHDAIPLQGTWYGSASDHLAMQVAVRVKAALNDGAFMRSYS
jgi:transglutaminase-like putative cysteine protease